MEAAARSRSPGRRAACCGPERTHAHKYRNRPAATRRRPRPAGFARAVRNGRRSGVMRRSVLRVVVAAALGLAVAGLSACAGANQNGALKGGSNILTIQGDAGDPTLTENFN